MKNIFHNLIEWNNGETLHFVTVPRHTLIFALQWNVTMKNMLHLWNRQIQVDEEMKITEHLFSVEYSVWTADEFAPSLSELLEVFGIS